MKRRFRIGEYESDPGRDVREEMDAHVELEVERLKALGMGEAEARRPPRWERVRDLLHAQRERRRARMRPDESGDPPA